MTRYSLEELRAKENRLSLWLDLYSARITAAWRAPITNVDKVQVWERKRDEITVQWMTARDALYLQLNE